MTTPFSSAAERNKQPILERLQEVLGERNSALEIGSGTAQHVLHFAEALSQVVWQPSNLPEILEQTQKGLEGFSFLNILEPIALDVAHQNWPKDAYDIVYTANTCHIMAWESVIKMFEGVGRCLGNNGLFCVYGPFNYDGQFTSDSNREFDGRLKESVPTQGIRDQEKVVWLGKKNGLELQHDFEMPANNRFLVFLKTK